MLAFDGRAAAMRDALEIKRGHWDRMALCGQVPVNIEGLTAADIGKFLVAAGGSDGRASAVPNIAPVHQLNR
jgi:hypothetical protein